MHGTNSIVVASRQRSEANTRRRPDPGSQAIIPIQSSGPNARNGSAKWGNAPDPEQWIGEWERRMAADAVKDLENCGADQDLEALRAGWSTSQRPGGYAVPRPTRLNQRGDVAARRLSTVNHLRRIAEGQAPPGEVSESSVPGALCLTDAPGTHEPRQRTSKAEFPAHEQPSSKDPGTNRKPVGRRPSPHRASNSSLKGMLEEDDPWSAWERKWADAFEQLGATSRKSARPRQSGAVQDNEHDGQKIPAQNNNQNKAQHGSTRTRPGGYPRQRSPGNSSYNSTRPPPRSSASRASSPPNAGSGPGGSSRSSKAPPPRAAQPEGKPPVPRKQPGPRFANFNAYEEAWSRFEKGGALCNNEITLQDIPWPMDLPTVSGIEISDSSSDCKRKLRAALLRWHPDKWGPILGRIRETDKNEVTERVKEVTRRILEEKAQHS